MSTVWTMYTVAAGATFLFFYIPARFIDWEKLFDDAPDWWSKFNPFNRFENWAREGRRANMSYSERLALHPIATMVRSAMTILGVLALLMIVIMLFALWPVTWSFLGYLFFRKLRLIRSRHMLA